MEMETAGFEPWVTEDCANRYIIGTKMKPT